MKKRTLRSYKVSKLVGFVAKMIVTVVMVLVNVGYTFRDKSVPNPHMWVNWTLLGFAIAYKITSLIMTIVLAIRTRKAYQKYEVSG